MSYLQMPDAGINMAKATVSVWFRYPKETIASVLAHPPPRGGAAGYSEAATWPVLQWQCTLLSWGEQVQGKVWWDTLEQTGTISADSGGPHEPVPFRYPVPTLSQTGPMAPCYIGLDFRPEGYDAQIIVNLQSSQMNSIQNVYFILHFNVVWVGGEGFGHAHQSASYEDRTWSHEKPLGIGKTPFLGDPKSTAPNVAPDVWHHLLISWDVTGSITCGGDSTVIQSGFKMYFALDDKNYNKSALPSDWIGDVFGLEPGAAGTDPNTIVSDDSILSTLPWPAGEASSDIGADSSGNPAGSFSGTMGPLPAKHLFVPGSPNYTDGARTVNSVYQVEMAELQIFAGLMLDTSEERVRRAFVDRDGKPVPPKETEDILGRRPDILLHRTSNWKKGKNTGSIGLNKEGEEIPAGQFTPTEGIVSYKPDPVLEDTPPPPPPPETPP